VEGVMKWSNLKGMTEKQKKIMTLYYYASITQIDEMVGKIVEIIKRKGISDNTWIIYHADHGEMLGDHMMSHKLVFYESALRVPCIIKPPDNHDGRLGWNSSALADTLDVVATMIDIAGAESLKDSESRSLLSKISNGDEDPEAHVGKDYVISEVIGFAMIRNEKCKLSVNLNKGNPKKFWGVSTDTDSFMDPVEMYDVEKDPDELHNVVRDPQYEEVRNKLLGKLDDHIQKKLGHEKLQRFVTATSTGSALARG
jgi:choline-sulfatase